MHVDSKLSANKTQNLTLSTTMWNGLQPLQEIVTPSPVEPASKETLEESINDSNDTESPAKLKDEVDVNIELKQDLPALDKFVRGCKFAKKQKQKTKNATNFV